MEALHRLLGEDEDDGILYRSTPNVLFREWQLRVVAILPHISGSISFICSLLLLFMLFRAKQQVNSMRGRLLLGKVVADLIQSMSLCLSTVPAPRGTIGVWNPLGTATTCQLQGFFIFMGTTTSLLYTSASCIYFVGVIKYKINEDCMVKREMLFHALPILWGFLGGIILLFRDSFQPDVGYCWASPLMTNEDELRGATLQFFSSLITWLFILPCLVLLVTMCHTMLNIYLLFHWEKREKKENRRKREERRRQREEEHRREEEENASVNSSIDSEYSGIFRINSRGDEMQIGVSWYNESISGNGLNRSHTLIRQSNLGRGSQPAPINRGNPFQSEVYVIRTAIRYFLAFLCSYFFLFVTIGLSFASNISRDHLFVWRCLEIFFFSLQGCFNFVIYFEPKFMVARQGHVNTWLQAFFQTINTGGEPASRPNIRQIGQGRLNCFQLDEKDKSDNGSESETGAITNDSPFVARINKVDDESVHSGLSEGPLPNSESNPFESRESIDSIFPNDFVGTSSQDRYCSEEGNCHHEYPARIDSQNSSHCNYQSSSSDYSQSSIDV